VTFRVLHVLDHSWPVADGYAQRSRSIVTAQVQVGMQPSVLTGPLHEQDDPSASELSLDGVRYFRTPHKIGLAGHAIQERWPLFRELAVVRLLRQRIESLLRHEQFDIIHAHSPALCGLAAAQVAHSCGIPFVYEVRAFWEDAAVDQNKTGSKSIRYTVSRRLETHVLRSADAIVGIARPLLEDLRGRGISASKLFHVPNGVDTSRFAPQVRDDVLAAKLGLNDGHTLGFVGTLFPWEGIAWLVRAVSELRKSGIEFKLVLVGDGADASEVKKAIQERDAGSYVSFIGHVPHDQVERYYSVMDVMVYPRRSVRLTELVTPLKPLEAMALGKAILGSGVGGIRELIEPEVTGVLFEPGNVQEFAQQTTRLLQDEKLRRSLGERARQRVTQEKDWKALARKYESVYAAACHSASSR
jgi:glycogen(starch) synthase